jgi:hypothetical protein
MKIAGLGHGFQRAGKSFGVSQSRSITISTRRRNKLCGKFLPEDRLRGSQRQEKEKAEQKETGAK